MLGGHVAISADGRLPAVDRETLLLRFLSVYWLRPENALWMTLRSDALRSCPLPHPSLDVACGDGLFSFLHLGGVLDPAFDVFTSVDGLGDVLDKHHDMFDHAAADYQPEIVGPPGDVFDVGLDGKPSLLAKASKLELYTKLVRHDANEPLPFADASFRTVYCNAAYWMAHIDGFLRELCRVVRDDGSVILHVKLSDLRDYTLHAHRDVLGDKLLNIIARGRLECWPSLTTQADWEARFSRAGLCVEEARPFITRTHAHLWDIGLRPMAPLLIEMANDLTPARRNDIKRRWVELFADLLEPFCDPAVDLSSAPGPPGEIHYVLTKRRR